MPHICMILLKDYCANCSLAGLRFIVDDTKHWVERCFWVVLVVLSWCGSTMLIITAWDAFVFHPISFGLDTTYIDWNTEMPAVAICEWDNPVNLNDYIDTHWPMDHNLDIEDTLREILFFRGFCDNLVAHCHKVETPDPNCPLSNYSYYTSLLRRKCPEIITSCSYNDKPFDCCEFFQPINTDTGPCFILNSIQIKNPKSYQMVTNRTQKRAVIKFHSIAQSMMYTLGHEEIPTLTTSKTSTLRLQIGYNYSRHITVRNIENDPLLVETTIEQRGCRFYTENEGNLYPFYSYSNCIVQCRKKAQMETCQCNDHFMPGTVEQERCNISGLVCLNSNRDYLTVLKPFWGKTPGLTCGCLPSCNEKEITIVRDVRRVQKKQKFSDVELLMAYLPTERFKRNVVRSRLDLVVSVGGAAGLFVGASVLSFVEFIIFFTVRLGSTLKIIREKRKLKRVIYIDPKTIDILGPPDMDINVDLERTAYPTSGVKSLIPIDKTIQKPSYKNNIPVNKHKLLIPTNRKF